MNPEVLFSISAPLAISGWLALLLSPIAPRTAQAVAGLIVPGILSIGYAALILVHWSGAEGGFDTLANVMLLFRSPWLALAGWVHYLAFDLFVGAWIVRTARAERLPHLIVVPILIPTFLFGPAGFVLFLAVRAARTFTNRPVNEA